jgi:hypothetical protein
MRFYTTSEQGRRILGWVGIAGATLYAAFCVEEYVRTSASTAWWPVVLFWIGVTAFSVRALLTPRDYAAIDLTARVVRVVRRGAVTRDMPLGTSRRSKSTSTSP